MNKQDFSTAEIGQQLNSIHLGDCIVMFFAHNYIMVQSLNSGRERSYLLSGKEREDDITPSLFWSNPNIQIPPKPKRRVKKEVDGFVNIYPDGEVYFHASEKAAKDGSDGCVHKRVTGKLFFEVEE